MAKLEVYVSHERGKNNNLIKATVLPYLAR